MRLRIMAILSLLIAPGVFAQITLINHAGATSSNTNTVTTSTINLSTCTTAAHCMIAACVINDNGITPTVTDSQSDTWVLVSNATRTATQPGPPNAQLWVTFPTATGSATETVTVTTSSGFPGLGVAAFNGVASGADKISSIIIDNGIGHFSTGSVTPANNGELVMGCWGEYGPITGGSVAAPMTQLDSVDSLPNFGYGVVSGYQIQTTATAVNPTWSATTSCCFGGSVAGTFYSTQNPATLVVTTTSLPEGFNGVAYSKVLNASGGINPYTWTQTVGTLPTGLTLSGAGIISGTPTQIIANDAETFKVTDSASSTASSSGLTITIAANPLVLTATSCPSATQYDTSYSCSLAATGGTTPYVYSYTTASPYDAYNPPPEGISLNASTGVLSSSFIGGQGSYGVVFTVTDAPGTQATNIIFISVAGKNAFLSSIFPSNSIFHHRMDAATTGLPVDTSPAAPIYSGYQSTSLRVLFGTTVYIGGIPAIQVPCGQAMVGVTTDVYQSYFTSGPIPVYAPIEGGANNVGSDKHVLVYRQAGCGLPPSLWEIWEGRYNAGPWISGSNALWSDVTTNALTPMGNGTSDAAGLPISPLLLNVDEVVGGGTPAAPTGTVKHPTRFTLNHTLNYWVWPGTASGGTGSCDSIGTYSQISQSSPPSACTFTGPAGEIYRLKASVATPACAATSPQAAIIITGLRNYGIILADNGLTGGLIGTPDTRWNDTDLACLTQFTLANFEPVNVSSLIVSNSSGQTGSGSPAAGTSVSPGVNLSKGAKIQ